MKLHEVMLSEMPIRTKTDIGDFDKASSFRHPADRALVTKDVAVKKMKNAFSKTPHDFNFYFVNTPEGNKHTEVGEVDRDWLKQNMPKAEKDIKRHKKGITVIFTNNKGAQRIPFTPWIMAHRIGHATSRPSMRAQEWYQTPGYSAFANEIMYWTAEILEQAYGVRGFPRKAADLHRAPREMQLLAKGFWQAIGSFKSARDGKMRDYFEMWNELIAQYLTTGRIRFRDLPRCFKVGRETRCMRHDVASDDVYMGEIEEMLRSMRGYSENKLNQMFDSINGKFYVM